MVKYLIIISILFITISVNGQKRNNIWCFGDSCLINFNYHPPTNDYSIIRTRGTACSISDTNGNLLFYCGSPHIDLWQSGGYYFVGVCYNKDDQIMENGDSLIGELWYNEMVIVPDPENSLKYYLFHIEMTTINQGLYYSIIDLSLNNGLGKIISKNNQLLSGYMADGITAVKHGNGKDWWVIARRSDFLAGGHSNNDFYVFSITTNGITPLPIQSIGSMNSTNGASIKFNPSGEKFVFVNWKGLLEEYNFDRCTGIISNPVNIEPEASTNFPYIWGEEYSPSDQYLYTSTSASTSCIYQYDLLASNIQASRKTIFTFNQFTNAGGELKRGPDGKIYYALSWNDGSSFNFPYPDSVYNMYNMNLGVINQPDMPDTLCDFQPFSFYLGGKRNYYGLPNNPDYDLGPLAGSICDTLHISVNEIIDGSETPVIFPNPFNDVVIIKNISPSDKYVIELYDYKGSIAYSKKISGENSFSIDCSNLSCGFYVIRIEGKDNVFNYKLIKN